MLDQPRKRDGYHQTDVISVRVMNNWLIVMSFIALKPEAQNFVAVGLFLFFLWSAHVYFLCALCSLYLALLSIVLFCL